jgi:uncharacterized protein YkwD
MAAQGYFSHTGLDGSTFRSRAREVGYRNAAGENIAWGFSSPQDVVRSWMSSPGHRANIVDCENRSTGLGLASDSGGTPYWTLNVGRV